MGPYQTVYKKRTQDVLRDRTQYTEPDPDWLTEPKAVHGTACVSVNNCRNYHGQRLIGRGVFVSNQMAITKHLEHFFGPERAMCTSRRNWRLQRQAAKGMLHAAPTKSACGTQTKGMLKGMSRPKVTKRGNKLIIICRRKGWWHRSHRRRCTGDGPA